MQKKRPALSSTALNIFCCGGNRKLTVPKMQKLARQPALHKPTYRDGNRLQNHNGKCFKPAWGFHASTSSQVSTPAGAPIHRESHYQKTSLWKSADTAAACEQISGAKTEATICPKRKANARAASEHPRSDALATDLDIAMPTLAILISMILGLPCNVCQFGRGAGT